MYNFTPTKNLIMPKLKVIIPTALISIALGSGITFFIMNSNDSEFVSKSETRVAKKAVINADCNLSLMRLKTSSRLSSPPKGVELVEINKTERERNKVKILFIGWWIEPD